MLASRAFRAEMLSAKRQFMGMLGLEVPVKEILEAHFEISEGRVLDVRGLFRMPVSKTSRAARGIE